jgi:hypothetical protein
MIAAGDAGVSVLGCIAMSPIPLPHFGAGARFSNRSRSDQPANHSGSSQHSDDNAIDMALCAVPLPEGLMTRLGTLVYTMPEDTPDPVDWLGC